MCVHLAQSYLHTIQRTDKADTTTSPHRWEMAVDIETDLYNMCLLDLDRETLKQYRSTIIDKYQR